ncbi:MAG TPA: alpha/beta fold hydrolase, partial [Gemmatimonadales bacterium]|nr:alpha/beta fold hydrolase [Gemmatimonadales bacterium]
RWEMVFRGVGKDLFTTAGVWPAVRKTTIEYLGQALPGDRLRFDQLVTGIGKTSFTMQQSATQAATGQLVATIELLFVCVNNAGKPVPVPDSFRQIYAVATQAHPVNANGVRLAVEDKGEGPTILFVHGYPLGRYIWRHQVDHLSGWRRINPDLRGLGQSSIGRGPGRIETYADDLVALLDRLEIPQAVVCGLSMGGYVALDLARRYRNRLSGLILMATRAEPDTPDGKQGREAAMELAGRSGARAIGENMIPKLFAADASDRIPDVVALVREHIDATTIPGIVQALEALRDRSDSRPLLPSLGGLPTLVVSGASDRLMPAEGMKAMAAIIPGAVYQSIEGAGHLPPLERAEESTAAIATFLGGISR